MPSRSSIELTDKALAIENCPVAEREGLALLKALPDPPCVQLRAMDVVGAIRFGKKEVVIRDASLGNVLWRFAIMAREQ